MTGDDSRATDGARMAERILVVEDEKDLAQVLEYNLRQGGFEPLLAHDGAAGLRMARDVSPALVLLDVMLPDLSGIEVCKQLKAHAETASLPIVMLTARAEESDRVKGLEAGADDYVTKPFSVREVMLRVRAVLRRAGKARAGDVETHGALRIDRAAHRVHVSGEEIELTATELRLLVDLVDANGRVRTRDALLDRVWGYVPEVVSRTVDTHVRRLREKLGEAGSYVVTVRGIGYRFDVSGGDE